MIKVSEEVILYPLMTGDAIGLIETENKLTFIVDIKANKSDVKRSIEKIYEVKVKSVNLLITPTGRKKAYVKLHPENKASDLAIRLGIF